MTTDLEELMESCVLGVLGDDVVTACAMLLDEAGFVLGGYPT